MPGISSQRAYQREELALRMRRPPEEYVSLLSQNEQEFRSYVDTFEDNPLFSKLLNDGVISKVRLRGKIPRGRYEEYMDQQLLDFLNSHDIVNQPDWERDFLSPSAITRAPELATKYKVPVGPLLRHLRYLHSTGRHASSSWQAPSDVPDRRPAFDRTESTATDTKVDLSDIIETTREFVVRYEVSEQEFLDLILGGDATAEQLAEQFGCSLLEAEEVLEAADRVYLAESYETSGATVDARRSKGEKTISLKSDDPVAFVQVVDGELSIQFEHDSVYTQRYHIRSATMRTLKADPSLPTAAREMLTRARFINQRLSALSRLIRTLCSQQMEYLTTGDLRQMKPLAQAELARQLGEHPSTVSRLIRGKVIETPHSKIPLLFLCQSKTDVVARLIAEYPKLTDQEVVSRLREDYNCFIARRTVAYHRGKRLRRNKRRGSDEAGKTGARAVGAAKDIVPRRAAKKSV